MEEGFFADVVVFDAETVGLGETYTKYDLPTGAGRLYADATGIEHVIANGARSFAPARTQERVPESCCAAAATLKRSKCPSDATPRDRAGYD
ncbi:MAG: hypothetical protein OXH78_01140 [Acidimicrobiaceae bacterium]|nr:hypothetical protein [Acidimicrobiaceae bacterium]